MPTLPKVRLLVLLRVLSWAFVAATLPGCAEPSARRPLQMVDLPAPSASPEPPLPPEPEPPTRSAAAADGMPQPLPTRARPDAGVLEPARGRDGDPGAALESTGWSLAGPVQSTQERGFVVMHAEIRKPGVRGHLRIVRGSAASTARMPHLPASASPGVLVETAGPKGAEAYFYDAAAPTLGIVTLGPPGTRTEASTVLRACFPF